MPADLPHRWWSLRPAGRAALLSLCLVLAGCGGAPGSDGRAPDGNTDAPTGSVLLYTSYNQPEVDALLASYRRAHSGVRVKVFRAPTGQLSARIAAEQRSGGIRADVLLLSDPLSMQKYADQGLLRRWSPPEADAVPAEARSDVFWGVTTSSVVAVHAPGASVDSWHALSGRQFRKAVALPDPSFAGSAFGALGYFAFADGYGLEFYQRLKRNGAVQVQAPGDVITGVAEGRFKAGMTLDFLARTAIAKGSPIEMSAPDPGAVRLYAPMAVFKATKNPAAAESFAGHLLTKPAQQALAKLDRHPVRGDVSPLAPAPPAVAPDWPTIFREQDDLLEQYRDIFGG